MHDNRISQVAGQVIAAMLLTACGVAAFGLVVLAAKFVAWCFTV